MTPFETIPILWDSKGETGSPTNEVTFPPASPTNNIPAATSQGLTLNATYASCCPSATWQKPITEQPYDRTCPALSAIFFALRRFTCRSSSPPKSMSILACDKSSMVETFIRFPFRKEPDPLSPRNTSPETGNNTPPTFMIPFSIKPMLTPNSGKRPRKKFWVPSIGSIIQHRSWAREGIVSNPDSSASIRSLGNSALIFAINAR